MKWGEGLLFAALIYPQRYNSYKIFQHIKKSEIRLWVNPPIQIHANCIILVNLIIEENFHVPMHPQWLFYTPLNYPIFTFFPYRVLTSIGLKYLTSLGLKNMNLTVALLLLILKGYPVNMILYKMMCSGSHLASYPYMTGEG